MASTSVSSGIILASGLLHSGKGMLNSILITDGSDVTIYDGTTAAGKVLFQAGLTADLAPDLFNFSPPVRCDFGLYVAITTGQVIVYYGGGD